MAKEFRYTVKGHWPFPLDMLRHDQSAAASTDDQAMIDRLSADHAPDRAAFKDVEINLVGSWKPNTARWESFGWAVPTDTDHAFYKAAAKREREERGLFEGALTKLTSEEREVVLARILGGGSHE